MLALPGAAVQPTTRADGLRPPPSRVFEDVSADLFSIGNRHYLVYADRLSGWSTLDAWDRTPSAERVIKAVAKNFMDLGTPVRFRSDGGPQFAASEFVEFLTRWGVAAVQSTPHYPQSNGHAESAVKAMKTLVLKASSSGRLDEEELRIAVLEWRNTPRSNGLSPAQIVFGHPIRSPVPAHHSAYSSDWQKAMEEADRKADQQHRQAVDRYDQHARHLKPFKVGDAVRIQDPVTKRWDQTGTVISRGRNRDYRIKRPSGRVLWRNRRYLRPDYSAPHPEPTQSPPVTAGPPPEGEEKDVGPAAEAAAGPPRRSTRRRMPKKRFDA